MLFTSNYVNFILYIIVNPLFILFRFYSIELLACPLTGPSSNRKETLFYGEITRMSWIPNCFFCCCDPEKKFLKEQQWSHSMSDFFFSHTSIQSVLHLFVSFIQYALARLLWLMCWSGKQAPCLGGSAMHILRLRLLTVKKPADFQSTRTLWEWRLLPASNWNEDQDCEPRGKVWAHVISHLALLSHPREAIHWRNVAIKTCE